MDAETAKLFLADLIKELQEIKGKNDDLKFYPLLKKVRKFTERVFGDNDEYRRELFSIDLPFPNPSESEDERAQGLISACNQLDEFLNSLHYDIDLLSNSHQTSSQPSAEKERSSQTSQKVFIVHGHDEAMKQTVARVLEKLGLIPVILHEQANKGKTIIEKLSEHSDVSFAVVLLSPDDIGFSVKDGPKVAKPRARQNVVFELGLFIGKIGREAVVVLLPATQEFEIPTDYSGIVFIPYDAYESWKYALVKELQAFGFKIDANKLLNSK